MNEKLNISWTTTAKSPADGGGNISSPEWRTVEEKLLRSLATGGTVTLDAEDENGRQSSLQVRAEGGNFVVMLGEESGTGWRVRTYKNSIARMERVSVLGDEWSDQVVCHDISVVLSMYRDFFETGDIPESLLSD